MSDAFDRCGRLASVTLRGQTFHIDCGLEHGHDGPHFGDLERGRPAGSAPGWRGQWAWTDGAPTDQGPGLADQILDAAS